MSFQATIYYLILIIAAVISASLAWYTWQHRQTTGAKPFSLLMLVLFEWGAVYLLQMASVDLVTKIFWNKIVFLGVVTTPVVWLLFALEYTGQKAWVTQSMRLIKLSILPIITIIVIWTNDAHHWFWTFQELRIEDDLYLINSNNGFWFWVHAAYSYVLLLAGAILIVRALLRWPAQYRGQMTWILFAVAAPWLANIITIFNLLPILIDLTPFAFAITGIGMTFALFRHRLLDLKPIARDAVIEGMKDGMIILDANDRIVDINQAAKNILARVGEQNPIGKDIAEAMKNWPQLIEQYQDTRETLDEVALGEGDAQHWYELNLSLMHDEKKERIGTLVIVRDITARKKAEEQLRQLSRAVEASPTSIIITDTNGNIQYANPKFTEVTGYTLEEVLGKNPKILKTDLTPVVTHKQMWEAISSGREWRGEFCNRKKNGETFWELASISPIEDADGNITYYVAVKEDITDRKRTQEALRIAYDQAMEASRAKSQLLANVSHELRTPLGGILGYAELLNNGTFGELAKEQTKATEEILQSVHYLTTMVNELLDSAQIQANTATLKERAFSPVALLQQVASGAEILAQKKGLDFVTSIDENLPEKLYGDDHRLRQILTNLIGNAIKFTTEGEVRVRLEHPDSEHWIMQVTDTGIGIPAEAQSFIFDPFKQADNAITRDNRGIGLGLSITKQLVELMGGRIMLKSQVGEGSTFSVLLPIIHQPEPAA